MRLFKLLLVWGFLIAASSVQAVSASLDQAFFDSVAVTGQKINNTETKRLFYFWASWCPDCRSKLRGELEQFVKKNNGMGLVTVNLDRDFNKGKKFIEEEKLGLSVIRDDDKFLRKTFNVYSVPGWVLLQKNNVNKWERVASDSGSDLEKIQLAINTISGAKR